MIISPRRVSVPFALLFFCVGLLLPFLTVFSYLDQLLAQNQKDVVKATEARLLHELDVFSEYLRPEVYLGSIFQNMERQPAWKWETLHSLSSEEIGAKYLEYIRHTTSFEPLLMIVQHGDSKELFLELNKTQEGWARNVSKKAAQEFLDFLVNTKDYTLRSGDKRNPGDGLVISTMARNFLRNILGIPRYRHFPPGEVKGFATHKCGGGSLYLYYRSIESPDLEKPQAITFCVVFPGWNPPTAKIVSRALSMKKEEGIQRKCILRPLRLVRKRFQMIHGPNQVSLEGIAPNTNVSLFSRVIKGSVPILRVNCHYGPEHRAIAVQRGWLAWGSGCSLLFALVLWVRWWLFREGIRVSLRLKLYVGLGVAILLPYLMFGLMAQGYGQSQQKLERQRVKERLRQILEIQETGISAFDTANNLGLDEFRQQVEAALDQPPARMQELLDQKHLSRLLMSAFLFRNDGVHFGKNYHLREPGLEKSALVMLNKTFSLLSIRLLKKVNKISAEEAKTLIARSPKNSLGMVLADQLEDGHTNEILGVLGRNLDSMIPNVGRVSVQVFLLRRETPGRKPYFAIFYLVKNPDMLAEQFFRHLETGTGGLSEAQGYQEILGDFEIRSGIFRILSRVPPIVDQMKAWPQTIGAHREFVSLAKMGISSRRSFSFDREQGRRMLMIRPFHNFPYVGVAQARLRGQETLVLARTIFSVGLLAYAVISLILITGLLSQTFERPLHHLHQAILEIRGGKLGLPLVLSSGDEFAMIGEECHKMSRALLERDRMRLFMSDLTMEAVAAPGKSSTIQQDTTVLFSDIRGFTELSEKYPAEEIVGLLNEYFSEMHTALLEWEGDIDRFIGDALFAVFRSRKNGKDPALQACFAALAMRERLEAFNAARLRREEFPIKTGIGIASGTAILGEIGSAIGRKSHTVVGNLMGIASHLESLSKKSRYSGIILSAETFHRVRDSIDGEEIDLENTTSGVSFAYEVKGKREGGGAA
jgi:class 3 adenylate cyclase